MNTVDPIKQPAKILAIKQLLMADTNPRNYLLFTMGINSALRSSDLRNLKVADILDKSGDIKKYLYMRVKKTGREIKIAINEAMREALKYYLKKAKVYSPDQYLFKSKRSDKPIDNVALFYLIKEWTKAVGLVNERYSAHSLRKTWGYQARKYHGASIDMISEKLGHRSSNVTKRYIGIDQEEINKMEEEICI
ncbi:site-specific integrase [Candidatus Atribacteria bacterium 1244-E10-H5-B2]|nr:MAG: site-specific integrase [Candidatus Atribacteria bacterium 1244-E10-H5-B2]